ncbi:hypothetical protein O1M63_53040 [Streptomyces mirabilis]|nr:hypothetical protein [Streptomyces mirabilis]
MTPLRRLSDVEAAFARTHALMHGTTQVTTHVTVRGDLDPAHFRRGAERWAAELPLLSLRIEGGPTACGSPPAPDPGPDRSDTTRPARRNRPTTYCAGSSTTCWRPVVHCGGYASSATRARGRRTSTSPATTRSRTATPSTGAVVRALLDALFAPTDGVGVHDVRTPPPNGDALTYRPPRGRTPPVREFVPRPDRLPFAAHRPWDERAAVFVPLAFTREESLALKS